MPFRLRLAIAAAIALLTLLTFSVRSTLAADEAISSQVDSLAAPLIDSDTVVGMSVALVRGEDTWFAGYGTTSRDNSITPDRKTIYEIGSVTKVFTSLLLAEMARNDKLRLDDPVTELLPGRKIPAGEERAIQLVDLATHSSGLPRMPKNFAPADPRNPYADYTVEKMFEFLADYELHRQPGERYAYSNLGVGLLGVALATRADQSYETLVVESICDPLQMPDTRITLTSEQRERLAPGHDADGRSYPNWDIPGLAGAGALRSTTEDLAKFLRAQLGLNETPLDEAIRMTQEPRFERGRNRGSVALGWHIAPGGKLLNHSGQTGAYHSYVAMDPKQSLGVVILANTATGEVDRLGSQYVRLLRETPSSRSTCRVN